MRTRLSVLVLLLLLPRAAAASWPSDPATGVALCVMPGQEGEPEAISDGKGGAIVTWYDNRGTSTDVYIQRVDANGTPKWTANGVLVCGLVNFQTEPAIASDGAGGAIVAWADNRGASGVNYTPDIYAQRVDSTGAMKWAANGVVIAAAANAQYQPRVLADGSGGAFLTWTDERSGAGFGRIYVQHLNSSGVAQWTANGVSTNNSPSGENYPWIISNGAGGVLVAWEDYRSGDQDIYTQRVLANGTLDPAWPVGGRQMCSLFQEQEIGGLVSDGSGGALVTWPQWNGGTRDIFVHHVLSTGALDPAWPGAGRRLSNDFYDQNSPAILADGSGGVLVTYFDRSYTEVCAKHVFASGAVDPAFPDTGLVLCTSSGSKLYPTIVPSDTAAIVVWMDSRNGDYDLYAQRFFRTGVVDPAWPSDGRAISVFAGSQGNHTAVPDGTGGAIVLWEDRRVDDGDIYAQALRVNGTIGDPPVGLPGEATFDFDLRSPNPVRAGAMVVHFTLPGPTPAALEVFNVGGRRVTGRSVAGAGAHAIDLASGWNTVPGVYFVRLSQGTQASVRRIVILD